MNMKYKTYFQRKQNIFTIDRNFKHAIKHQHNMGIKFKSSGHLKAVLEME